MAGHAAHGWMTLDQSPAASTRHRVLGLLLLLSACGAGGEEPKTNRNRRRPAPAKLAGVHRYTTVTDLFGPTLGVHEFAADAAARVTHFRITFREGRVVLVEEVLPGGLVLRFARFDAQGGSREFDAFGTLVAEYRIDAEGGGVERVLRSGARANRGCHRLRVRRNQAGLGL